MSESIFDLQFKFVQAGIKRKYNLYFLIYSLNLKT